MLGIEPHLILLRIKIASTSDFRYKLSLYKRQATTWLRLSLVDFEEAGCASGFIVHK